MTLFATEELHSLIATSLPAEAILHPIRSFREKIFQQPLNALCIGSGLGKENTSEILEIVREATMPSVIDADALNAVADDPKILHECRGPRLLTPHPASLPDWRRIWLDFLAAKLRRLLLPTIMSPSFSRVLVR